MSCLTPWLEIDWGVADVGAIARELLPTLCASAGTEMSVRLALDSVSAVAMVDRGQIEQILLNLVQNSREAHAHTVTSRVSHTRVSHARVSHTDDTGAVGDQNHEQPLGVQLGLAK